MRHPGRWAIAVAALALTGVSGCGSSHSSSSTPKTTTAPAPSGTTTAPTTAAQGSGGSAGAAVAANWTAFFSAKTPTARRVALLQDGSQFATIIKDQAKSVLAQGASAKVLSTAVSGTKATVVYDLVVDGNVALKNQKGTAVSEGGQWKVGVGSFCGLLTLENAGKTAGLPTACHQAHPA
jgi:hypothetical protein